MRRKINARLVQSLKPGPKPYEVFDTREPGFFLRVQPSGVMTYYLVYRNTEGRQRRYRIGRASSGLTAEQARDVAENLRGEIVKGRDVHAHRVEARKEADAARKRTLGVFLGEHYEPWARQNQAKGTDTTRRIRTNFPDLLETPMTEITPWVIEKWRTSKLKQGRSPSTINRDVFALRSCLSRAVEWRVIPYQPLQRIKPLKTDKNPKIRFLSDDEAQRLRDALADRDAELKASRERANEWRRERGYPTFPSMNKQAYADHLTPLVLVSLNTGIRRGEAFSLHWSDVDLKGRMLTIVGSKAKSKTTRHVPLNDEAFAALVAWRNQTTGNGLVWPGKDGGQLNNVHKAWHSLMRRADIRDFRWHDLRHTFASWLVMRGVPLNTVRDLLGHAELSTTLRYAHLAPDHRAEAVNLLNAASDN